MGDLVEVHTKVLETKNPTDATLVLSKLEKILSKLVEFGENLGADEKLEIVFDGRKERLTFFELEKKVHEALLELHKEGDSHGDAQLTDFIEGELLKEQVEAQKEIGTLITQMRNAGDGLGLHIIDKEIQ